MVYMGSKNRIAKELLPFIIKDLKEDIWYVEPFVGGANMIDKIEHPYKLGADNNKYLIALLKAVQNRQELPKYISKEEYLAVKTNKDNYPDWYVGFVGFICSFRGKFFGGYSGITVTANGTRNYIREKTANLQKQKLKDIQFVCSTYDNLNIPKKSVIYCDPPYQDTTKYKDSFNSEAFWNWCRKMVAKGYKLYISEYKAPSDFIPIWQKEITNSLSSNIGKKTTEKLFIHKSQL